MCDHQLPLTGITVKLDSVNLAANFGQLSAERSLEHRVLVARSDGETLSLVTDGPLDIEHIQSLEFTTGKQLHLIRVDPSAEFDAALMFYATRAGTSLDITWMLGCDSRYKRRCPLNWYQLAETQDPAIRDCGVCEQPVYLAKDSDEARRLAALGHCTAYPDVNADVPDYLVGDIAPTSTEW
jgi:hypothetical protein